jgi:hypothetical protein
MHVQPHKGFSSTLRVLAMQLIEAIIRTGHIPQLQSPTGQDAMPGATSWEGKG